MELLTYREWLEDSEARGGSPPEVEACAVCLSDFEDTSQIRLLLTCRHAFHRECIDGWLRNQGVQAVVDAKRWSPTCPLCRAPVLGAAVSHRNPRQRSRAQRDLDHTRRYIRLPVARRSRRDSHAIGTTLEPEVLAAREEMSLHL
jgi:hypothetical protein